MPDEKTNIDELTAAIEIAARLFKDKTDFYGVSYISNLTEIAGMCCGQRKKAAAFLKDVVSFGFLSLDDIKAKGFSAEIVKAIECLTAKKDESRQEYFQRILKNEIAAEIKAVELYRDADFYRGWESDDYIDWHEEYRAKKQRMRYCHDEKEAQLEADYALRKKREMAAAEICAGKRKEYIEYNMPYLKHGLKHMTQIVVDIFMRNLRFFDKLHTKGLSTKDFEIAERRAGYSFIHDHVKFASFGEYYCIFVARNDVFEGYYYYCDNTKIKRLVYHDNVSNNDRDLIAEYANNEKRPSCALQAIAWDLKNRDRDASTLFGGDEQSISGMRYMLDEIY
ncbi:MAG: hypothetical protein LBT30_00685 [Clostridiales bacterium]|jgi:hypothetical protein|nr:hypothetical protein [Clostridiales bacterium]